MAKLLNKPSFSPTSKLCLAGLFMAIATILQKVLAINNLPIIPFLRISLGGPAVIVFSSWLLGPWYGLLVGAGSDLLGYVLFDPRAYSFFPTITLIYGMLGFVSYYFLKLFTRLKNKKVIYLFLSVSMGIFLAMVTGLLWFKNEIVLYQTVYKMTLLIRVMVPVVLFVFLLALILFIYFYDRRFSQSQTTLPFNVASLGFALFLLELIVMVGFGSLMKACAFGFTTFGTIILCQLMVLFINVPLNTITLSLLMKVTGNYFSRGKED